MSYFRQKAAQTYRRARSSLTTHENYELLMKLGIEFKARATEAAARLARMRGTALRRQEADRQEGYRDSRE
jgi:cell division septal protein FtsQ